MAEYQYSRGARRSAAPTYTPWTAPQTSAQGSVDQLSALMRQPQQARQAAPQMQNMNGTPPQGQLSGVDPAALQAMIRQQIQMQRDREAAAFGTESAESRADVSNATNQQATMGPASPGAMRTLRMLATVGIGGMGLGPMAAMLGAALSNPNSSTAPTTALAMNGVRRAVPQLGVIDMLTQMFGADPISREVDNMAQALVRPAAAPAPAGTPAAPQQGGQQTSRAPTNYGGYTGAQFGLTGDNTADVGLVGDLGSYQSAGSLGRDVWGINPSIDFGGDDSDSNNDRSGGNTGRGGIRGGGSFGEGQY